MGSNAFGQPLRRREDARLLTGTGRFTADLIAPGTAQAVMVRSPHAHARIAAIDTAVARAMPGVLAVLTGADYARDGLGGIPSGSDLIRLPGTPADQDFAFRPERPALAMEIVRFVGDSVAMVVAESEALARDAAEAVLVEYEPLPAVTRTEEACLKGAPPVWPEAPDNVCFHWQAGDRAAVDAAFARAHRVVRLDAVNPRVHVGALETRGAIGGFAGGRYTLRTGSQMPHGLKSALAEVLGVAPEGVRVLVADVGGSFGIKNALYPEQVLVLWAARKLGREVAWIGERADGFLSDYHARDNAYAGELALDAEGRFLGLRVTSIAAVSYTHLTLPTN